MGRSHFLTIVLVSALLFSSSRRGFGRRIMEEAHATRGGVVEHMKLEKEKGGTATRKMAEVMDYSEPEPNTNPRSGFLASPPPPTP